MKKILLMLSIFSLSFAGTVYMAYDVDETENNIAIEINKTDNEEKLSENIRTAKEQL